MQSSAPTVVRRLLRTTSTRDDRPRADFCLPWRSSRQRRPLWCSWCSSQATVSSAWTWCPLAHWSASAGHVRESPSRTCSRPARNGIRYADRREYPTNGGLLPPSALQPVAPRCQSASGPVVEQFQGRLDAAGEELVREVAVCQRSGELQGADRESEDRERVGSSRLGVCPAETRRDD